MNNHVSTIMRAEVNHSQGPFVCVFVCVRVHVHVSFSVRVQDQQQKKRQWMRSADNLKISDFVVLAKRFLGVQKIFSFCP